MLSKPEIHLLVLVTKFCLFVFFLNRYCTNYINELKIKIITQAGRQAACKNRPGSSEKPLVVGKSFTKDTGQAG